MIFPEAISKERRLLLSYFKEFFNNFPVEFTDVGFIKDHLCVIYTFFDKKTTRVENITISIYSNSVTIIFFNYSWDGATKIFDFDPFSEFLKSEIFTKVKKRIIESIKKYSIVKHEATDTIHLINLLKKKLK